MKVKLIIQRFDPSRDKKPTFQSYLVEAEPSERIIDLLIRIKQYQDGSLAFRKSCVHGVCGSDAIRINGSERLACKVLVQDVLKEGGPSIRLQPLRNLPVEKDLMVDQKEFFRRYRSIKPFLINKEKPPEKEWIQLPNERKMFDEATKCILCEACYSACPVIQKPNPNFLGPAQIVQAKRFNDDSRDRGFRDRLTKLDTANGVWACENHFKCTLVCPRGIRVTKLINETKQQIKRYQ